MNWSKRTIRCLDRDNSVAQRQHTEKLPCIFITFRDEFKQVLVTVDITVEFTVNNFILRLSIHHIHMQDTAEPHKHQYSMYDNSRLPKTLADHVWIKVKLSKVRGFIQRIVAKRLQCATASHKSALISASQPYCQASANTARPRDTSWCITQYACLLPQLCRVLIPAKAGSGGVGLGAWFHAKVVYPSKGGHWSPT